MPEYMAFKDSFCIDGVTSQTGNETSTNRCQVMFILKESNVTEQNGEITKGINSNHFWFNKNIGDSERNRYAERLRLVIRHLVETQGLEQIESEPYYYMNLNKRGGYGKVDSKSLKRYVQKYKAYIEKQIDLFAPKYIICCGCYNLLAVELFNTPMHNKAVSIFPQEYKCKKVFHIRHPSSRNPDLFSQSLGYIG